LNEHMPERSDKCPWGTNGLIRQYLPKKSDFTQFCKEGNHYHTGQVKSQTEKSTKV